MELDRRNPIERLFEQLGKNARQGIIPSEPEPACGPCIVPFGWRDSIDAGEATETLEAALTHSRKLNLITPDEELGLAVMSLSLSAEQLLQAKRSINVVNALFEGLDIRPDQANHLIHLFCKIPDQLGWAVLERMIGDLRVVDNALEELVGTGQISIPQYKAIKAMPIGMDRVDALLELRPDSLPSTDAG